MDVSENGGTPKSSSLIGFSIIFTIHFGVPLFLETPISVMVIQVDRNTGGMNTPKLEEKTPGTVMIGI